MRWLFLLLLMLNSFYYLWHQQEAPLRAKEVTSLSSYKGSQQDIRLLSESGQGEQRQVPLSWWSSPTGRRTSGRAAVDQSGYTGAVSAIG